MILGSRKKEFFLAIITATTLSVIVFWLNKPRSFPEVPRVKFLQPSGYSVLIPEDVYACIKGEGFQIDSAYHLPELECIGPVPEKSLTHLDRHPHYGYSLAPIIEIPELFSEEYCGAYYEAGIYRFKGREAQYVICSDGGGSGGLEYSAWAKAEIDGQIYVTSEGKQDEWDVPDFKRAFKTLLTIEN